MKRAIVIAISVLLALIVALPMAFAQVGQGAKASGKAAELAAAWTQWAYSKPVQNSPLIGEDPDYSEEQCDGTPLSPTLGKTWFLAGTPDGTPVERTCTMPVGTQLFFPIVSATFFITEPNETPEDARAAVEKFIRDVLADPELSIVVTVDGKEIKSNRIVRAKTPFFTVTLPENNILQEFGVEPGEYQTITNGLWVALPPLSKGEHTIHFEISAPTVGFSQDNTYNLTVTTPSGTAPATTPATAAATAPAATTPPTTATTPAATTPPTIATTPAATTPPAAAPPLP